VVDLREQALVGLPADFVPLKNRFCA